MYSINIAMFLMFFKSEVTELFNIFCSISGQVFFFTTCGFENGSQKFVQTFNI